jgi:hypothetical protein
MNDMIIERCPYGSGKWLLWKGGYYQDHFIPRNQLVGEFDTQSLALEKQIDLINDLICCAVSLDSMDEAAALVDEKRSVTALLATREAHA